MSKNISMNVGDFLQSSPLIWPHQNILTADKVSIKSRKLFYWYDGNCKHTFEASPFAIFNGTSCTFCSGRAVLTGFNDLETTDPHLIEEWDFDENTHVSPKELSRGSRKIVSWKCKNGHSWESSVKNRAILKRNCAVCSKKRVQSGENDVLTQYPEISQYWDFDKNISVELHTLAASSRKLYWFKCENDHSYQGMIESLVLSKNSGCPYCAGRKVLVGFNDLASQSPELLKDWDYEKNILSPSEVTNGSGVRVWWRCENGHSWDTRVCDRSQSRERNCPKCSNNVSEQEKELRDFIIYDLRQEDVITSDRNVLNGKELDIFIPSKKIAIEFNGVYWHSEGAGKDQYYHYDKWKKCHDQGIQLITIWEDDWRDKKEIIKSLISNKIGNNKESIGARRTIVKRIDFSEELKKFMNINHIQGFVVGNVYLGLFDNKTNVLLAVMILKKEKTKNSEVVYNLLRFASSTRVIGGHSKMLNFFVKNYDFDKLITFADHEVSNGKLYERTGWIKDKELPPDYKYLVNSRRIHKFNFRKAQFKNNPNLLYQEDLTEKQLALLNGFDKVWDCGKSRYTYYK